MLIGFSLRSLAQNPELNKSIHNNSFQQKKGKNRRVSSGYSDRVFICHKPTVSSARAAEMNSVWAPDS